MDKTKHVCSFFPQEYESNGSLAVHRVGWRDASTFTGFCAKHDSAAFAPIDTAEFNGSAEQCFLIGYRALCHEIYQKSGALRADPIIRQMVDRGQPPELQRHTQELFAVLGAGASAGLQDFRRLKEAMDKTLLQNDYNTWPRAVISFKGPLCVASTGAATPDRTIDGRQLQVLHETEKPVEELPFGVVTGPGGGAVVFSWRPGEKTQWQFIEPLLGKQRNKLPSLLVQWMFAYVENTYFSAEWWESLSQMAQRHLNALAAISNPYYTSFPFLPMSLCHGKLST